MTSLLLSGFLLFASMPTSNTYQLHDYGIGTGGSSGMTSNNYTANGISGETSGATTTGTTYMLGPGEVAAQQANVPLAPSFSNNGNWYNKLHFIVNPDNHPSDAKFAIAISTDNFTTTQYIQHDNTVGNSLGTEDYQTYTSWGAATGEDVVGLLPSTTYKIKVKATTGSYTESAYSPDATAATTAPSMTFDLDVSSSDSETSPPYTINLSDLLPGTVVSGNERIWLDFETNAEAGGRVYLLGANAGLASASASSTITSVSADLAVADDGFGAQSASATQSSGGPLSTMAPYNGSGSNVGIIESTYRSIFTSSGPVTGGRASFVLMAKASASTPSATDYFERITIVASSSF